MSRCYSYFFAAAAVSASLSLACSTASAETITYGPLLSRGATPDSMIVRWGTSATGDATSLRFRQKGDALYTMAMGRPARDHEVVLTGLKLGTQYEYVVQSGTAMSATYTFATCPAPGMPLDVVFYGDSRDGATAHARVLSEVQKRAPDMVFESGDLTPSGKYEQYLTEFFPTAKGLFATIPLMAVPGNHDAGSPYAQNYGAIFPSPKSGPPGQPWTSYYTFQCGNSQFIGLDSNDVQDADQNKFLDDSLRTASQSKDIQHVFIWFHHSAYSPGSHGDANNVIANWVPIFRDPKNKVTAVFGGHDHVYARMRDSSDVIYVVSGGAGAPLYSDTKASRATKVVSKSAYNFVSLHIAGLMMSAVAYDDTGTEIDRFSITKPTIDPPPPPDMGADRPDAGVDTNDPLPMMGEGGCSLLAQGGRSAQATTGGLFALGLLGLLILRSLLPRRRRMQ